MLCAEDVYVANRLRYMCGADKVEPTQDIKLEKPDTGESKCKMPTLVYSLY